MKGILTSFVLIFISFFLKAQCPTLSTTGSTANGTTFCESGNVTLKLAGTNLPGNSTVNWYKHSVPNPADPTSGTNICAIPVPAPPPTSGEFSAKFGFNSAGSSQPGVVTPSGYGSATNLTISNGSYNQSNILNLCDDGMGGTIFGGPFNGGSFAAPPNYYQTNITISPPADCTVELGTVAVDISCSPYGPKNFKVTYIYNGGPETLLGQGTIDSCSADTPPSGSCTRFSGTISPSIFVSGAPKILTIKIYGWGGTGSTASQGKLRLENLEVIGTYTCQPKYTGNLNDCNTNPDCEGTTGKTYYYIAVLDPTPSGCTQVKTPPIQINVNCPTANANNNGPVCEGSTLTLTSSGAGLGPFTYSWSGPNGFTSTQQNPTRTNFIASYAGDYTVTVTGLGGCTATATTTVALNNGFNVDILIAGIPVPDDITVCQGINTTLTAQPTGGTPPYTYKWSTGPTTQSITVSPTSNTSYTVTVTDNTGCKSTKTVNVTVVPIPSNLAPLINSNSPVCEGKDIQLNYLSLPGVPQFVLDLLGVTYQWKGPLLYSDQGKNVIRPNATPNMSGIYTLQIEYMGCKSAPANVNVTVNPAPKTTVPADQKKCADENGNATFNLTTLNNTISGGSGTVTWFEDSGASIPISNISAYIVNVMDSPKSVYAKVKGANGCESTPVEVHLIVNPSPIINKNVEVEKCAGTNGFASFILADLAILVNGGSATDVVKWYSDAAGNNLINTPTHSVSVTTTIYAVITNSFTCKTGPEPVKLIVNKLPTLQISPTNPQFCQGDSIQLTSQVSGGNPNYMYSWSWTIGKSDSSFVYAKSSGTYSLTVTDSKGCTQTSTVSVIENPVPNLQITPINPIVCKDSTINFQINVTGGTPLYIYNWQTPDSNFVGSNTYFAQTSGTYSVKVVDSKLCSKSIQTQLTVLENPDAWIDSLQAKVCEGDSVRFDIKFKGKAPFVLNYSIGNQSLNTLTTSVNPYSFAYLPTNDEYLKLWSISDANYCQSTLKDSIFIGIDKKPVLISKIDSCLSATNYIVLLNVNAGIPSSFTVAGANGGTINGNTFTSNPISVNNPYSFTISNGGLCPSITVNGIKKKCVCDTKPGSMPTNIVNFCDGDSIKVTYGGGFINDGDDQLQFILHNGTAGSLGTILAKNKQPVFYPNQIAGFQKNTLYHITAVAGNSVQDTVDFEDACFIVSNGTPVIVRDTPSVALAGDNTICFGKSSILEFSTNGNTPFSISYLENNKAKGIQTDSTLHRVLVFPLDTTVYQIVSISDKYCKSTFNQSVTINVLFPQIGTINRTLCPGDELNVNGTIFNANNLSGKIILPSNASNGCDSIINVSVNYFAPVVNNLKRTLCFGQSLIVNGNTYNQTNPTGAEIVKGGSSNGCDSTIVVDLTFTNYVLNDVKPTLCPGETFTINGKLYDVNTISGSDTLKGASSTGCDSVISVQLTYLVPASGTYSTTLCKGETITIGNQTFSEQSPTGSVVLPKASSRGCDSTVAVNILYHNIPTGSFSTTLCRSETLTLGGTTFTESNPSGTVVLPKASFTGCDSTVFVSLSYKPLSYDTIRRSLCPGQNIVVNGIIYGANGGLNGTEIVKNGAKNGCDSVIYVDLKFYPPVVNTIQQTICEGKSILVNGKTYDKLRPVGKEIILGGAKNGCDSTINVNLTILPFGVNNVSGTYCPGSTLTFGTSTFGETTPKGTYIFVNGAKNGCDSIVNVDINFFKRDTFYLKSNLCEGQTITVNGKTYSETNSKGIEVLKNASVNGCDSVINVALTYFKKTTFNLNDTLCIGQSITVNGKIYNQTKPTGQEILIGGNSKGCDSTVNINLVYRPDIQASISGSKTICKDKSAVLTFNLKGGTTYNVVYSANGQPQPPLIKINDGFQVTVTPSVTTVYKLVSVNNVGITPCKNEIVGDATIVVDNLSLKVTAKSYQNYGISCPGATDGEINLAIANSTPPVVIKWSNGSTSTKLTNLASGIYTVSISSGGGCTAIDSVNLLSPPALVPFVTTKTPTCNGKQDGVISVDSVIGVAPIYFSLDNKSFFAANKFPFVYNHKEAGKYTIYIKDGNNCKDKIVATVSEKPELTLDLGLEHYLHLGDSVQLNPVSNFSIAQFKWSPVKYLSCDTCLNPYSKPTSDYVIYTLTAKDSAGCEIADNIRLNVSIRKGVFIPSAFSPNEDDHNNYFYPFGNEDVVQITKFQIFDRWGNMVFQAYNFPPNDPSYGWDGTFQNKLMTPAVFVYYAEILFKNGQTVLYKGDVTLSR